MVHFINRYNYPVSTAEIHSDVDMCQPDNAPSLKTLLERAAMGVVTLSPVSDGDLQGAIGVHPSTDVFQAMDNIYDMQGSVNQDAIVQQESNEKPPKEETTQKEGDE